MSKIEQGATPGMLSEGRQATEIGAGRLPFLGSRSEAGRRKCFWTSKLDFV
ncbi:hypothetical protein HYU89_01425 [Candidatus Collierbacteria bacterium]|nr:hypothetical protein [Candidatus Collierbacteria bacterium]